MNFTPLILESMGYSWVTRAPLVYNRDTEVITVPDNFATDLASVPKALWAIFPPFGHHAKAAVLHDYLYGQGTRPRKQCDEIFLEAMAAMGVSKTRRYLMYWAVRAFGKKAYGS